MQDVVASAFREALRQVFAETGIALDRLEPDAGPQLDALSAQLMACVGVTGDFRGNLVLCADHRSADGILRGMTAGLALTDDRLREFPRAAMGEIANRVAGRAVTLLGVLGRRCDITPPTVVTGERLDSLLPGNSASWTARGSFGALRLTAAHEPAKK